MIKFYDSGGTVHFGQATITRKTSVNGGLSLTGEVFAGDDVLNGLDYGWWLNFDNEKYVITYKKLSDDTNTIVFDAVQQFFWDFAKVVLHSQYTGSHEYSFYLGQLFDKSGYTYKNDVAVPAFEKENWGYKNKLDLFNDIIDQADVEFEVHNETVHIAKQIGSDLTSFVRKGINLSDLTEEMKISDFATYAKGYGAFKNQEDPSQGRLEVEYRSELANKFGDLEMDPIVDERYTIADNLIAELKKHVDATYTVSMTMNIYDLENAGYPNYESPKVGDWILAIDEALNFKRKIRIIKLEEQFDATGKRIGYTTTCGDLSIVDQYTNIQSSLDSKVQRIQESIDYVASSADGKSKNYYGAKEPMNADEGDLWFDQSNNDPDKWSIKQWANGRWEQLTLNPGEVDAKVNVAKQEAEKAVENAKSAADKADQLSAKYDDTNSLANQALDRAIDAQNSAAGLIDDVNKASQNADDAKSIANSVNSKYTTLTDGSTMTIAELENGLAAKLTKDDLSGYATETWTQNQIKVTADGINSTLSSVKTTVDGQTTSINDLKADSSGFKAQFVTVNDTLGKQTKDIGTLQATNHSLVVSFDSLNADNAVNQHNISQLQASATAFNSTLATVKQQVTDSSVGVNLLRNTRTLDGWKVWGGSGGGKGFEVEDKFSDSGQYRMAHIFNNVDGQNSDGPYWPGVNLFLNAGQVYTISIWAHSLGTSEQPVSWKLWLNWDKDHTYQSVTITNTTAPDWTHYSATFTATVGGQVNNVRIIPYFGTGSADNVGGSVYLLKPKLERGSRATDFSVNPADNATVDAVSSISQTVDAIQTTVRGKVDNDTYQSKVVQLSNQITSVVGQVNTFGKRNMVTNSQFQYDYLDGTSWTGGTTDLWYKSDFAWSWVNGYQGICINQPTTTDNNTWYNLFSRKIVIGQDISTPWSASAYINIDTVGIDAMIIVEFYDTKGARIGYKETHKKSRGLELIKVENAVPPTGTETVCLSFRVHGGGHVAMICPMLNQGDTAAAYVPDITTGAELQHAYSAILQTNDRINLRVEKNGVINAVNISPEGIQIYGNKLHITAATYIDSAVIKDGMIENLSADKITAGTINAAHINVINLNANNITTGTIKGSNLSINLNTGNVEFQAGRIHSSDNAIDININNKYISVANKDNRVFISGGEIQMIQPTLFSSQSTPYVRISNAMAGASWGAATFWARDYFVVTHRSNDGNIFTSPMGEERFSGISGGHSTSGWQVTKIGGAERGVLISGGHTFTDGISISPYIRVGDSGHAGTGMNGSNISMQGDYIYLKSPHTTSHGANAYLAGDGALVPSTSAAKYKTDIVRTFETQMGDKLLEVPVAHWKDKEEVLAKTLDPDAKTPETYFGMIADDLDDAGLNELVEYDDKGNVRGIQYDRVALSIIPLIRNYRDRITELENEVKQMKEV
ncbi:phage tail protein [Lactiplantibacillus plantarum]|uniref:phage tail protein n=1 Tax=Lactiplantibacillus plantarum TaxID=1590 RepID=UPI003F52C9BA